jgi:hypothetical protein
MTDLKLVVTDGPMPPCPEAQRHTPAPTRFMAWHEWARRMARTHHQVRCPACGLFAVWVAGRPDPVPLPTAPKLRALLKAASAVVAAGHGNLNQPRYGERVEAYDALRDALEEYGQW